MEKKADIKNYHNARKIAEEAIGVAHGKHEDSRAFDDYLQNNKFAGKMIRIFTATDKLSQLKFSALHSNKYESARILEKKMLKRRTERRQRLVLSSIISASAAAVVIFFILFFPTTEKPTILADKIVNVPTLILDEGGEINLEQESVTSETEFVIDKSQKNTIAYNHGEKRSAEEKVRYNMIVVPVKYTYNIILEDGTEVFLNANSKLRYPVSFGSDKRIVQLEGEAYFKVTKSSRPFIVEADGVDVQVYGTEFNVKAYRNEIFETVLVSGSVGVSAGQRDVVMLKPNQKCLVDDPKGEAVVSEVDVADYTAWRDGKFRYINQPLERVLTDFEAWYGVKLHAEDSVKNILITLNLNKTDKFEDVIKFLESIVDCKIINDGKGVYMVQ